MFKDWVRATGYVRGLRRGIAVLCRVSVCAPRVALAWPLLGSFWAVGFDLALGTEEPEPDLLGDRAGNRRSRSCVGLKLDLPSLT